MSITFGKRNTKEIYFGNRKVAKVCFGNQLIWPKFIPVPFDDNILFTYGNTDKIFRFKATKTGYTDEAVWKSVDSFNPPWLYKDGARIEPTAITPVSKVYDGDYWCYLNEDVSLIGKGIYYLDLKILGKDGGIVPRQKTRRCGNSIIIGDVIDEKLIIDASWTDKTEGSNDKLAWTVTRPGGNYSILRPLIEKYIVTIDGVDYEVDETGILEYDTSELTVGAHTAYIKAISKQGGISQESNIVNFTKSDEPTPAIGISLITTSFETLFVNDGTKDFVFYLPKSIFDYKSSDGKIVYGYANLPINATSMSNCTKFLGGGDLTTSKVTITEVTLPNGESAYKHVISKETDFNCLILGNAQWQAEPEIKVWCYDKITDSKGYMVKKSSNTPYMTMGYLNNAGSTTIPDSWLGLTDIGAYYDI